MKTYLKGYVITSYYQLKPNHKIKQDQKHEWKDSLRKAGYDKPED